METKVHIHKLNNENNFAWSYKIKLILIKEKVWKTITESVSTISTEITTWTPLDQLAQALIGLNVEDNQLLHIRNAANAKEAWETLKDIHEHDSVTNIVTLIRKMYATQMQEGSDLQTHLDKILDLFQKIDMMGEKISDTMRIGIILSSLSQSWNNLVTTLSAGHTGRGDLKLKTVLLSLQDEEIRRKMNPNQSDEKVLKISSNKFNNSEKPQEYSKKKIFCHFCKNSNHIMKDCRKLKAYNIFK